MSAPGPPSRRRLGWRQVAVGLGLLAVAAVTGLGNAVDPAVLDSSVSTAASTPRPAPVTRAATTPRPAPVTRGVVSRRRWTPPAHPSWYWQLQGTPRLEPVSLSDFDGFENSAATIRRFHAAGQHVICYLDAGTWENWRPDARRFPRSVLGRPNGWPGERWLDVRRLGVLEPLMAARLRMCARKGFDAVEPDNIDGFENDTGFPISSRQQLRYDEWIAGRAHALGLAVFQKNDPAQARQLEPYFDGVLDEQCNQYAECRAFAPYLRAGKPVLNAEYERSLYPRFCAADRRRGIEGALYGLALDGRVFRPCPT